MEMRTVYDEKNKLWKGEDVPPLYNPEISLGQVLLKALTIFGPKIAQINDDTGVQVTYDEMKTKTIRVAQNLQKLGYKKGQVFTFVTVNTDYLAPVVFASFCMGCPINALSPSYGKSELFPMLKATETAVMFCDLDVYDMMNECLTELKNDATIYTFGGKKGNSIKVETLFQETDDEKNFRCVQVDSVNDIAIILFSSGTTGLPKGASLSHAALINSADISFLNMNDVFFSFSGISWISGIFILLFANLHGGTRIITKKKFSPDLLIRLIETYKITFSLNAMHLISLLLKSDFIKNADLSSLKYCFVAGSRTPTDLPTSMKKYLPNGEVLPLYGMTEIGCPISFVTPDNNKSETVGHVCKRLIIKIVNDSGEKCGANVNGEIFIKPYFKFIGYYGNEKATKDLHDDEGFIRTADIGHFDDDGFLHFVDRRKDFLRSYHNKFSISPSDMEAVLIKSPEIKMVCVVGIPNEIDFDDPAAVVVPNDGSTLSEKDVFNMIADHFEVGLHLHGGVYFVNALPTTPTGKIIRRDVLQIAIGMYKNNKSTPKPICFNKENTHWTDQLDTTPTLQFCEKTL